MTAFLPPLILLAVAFLGYCALTRFMVRRNERIRAAMPDATVVEWAEAALAEGRSGKLVLGMFVTLAVAVRGALWLARYLRQQALLIRRGLPCCKGWASVRE